MMEKSNPSRRAGDPVSSLENGERGLIGTSVLIFTPRSLVLSVSVALVVAVGLLSRSKAQGPTVPAQPSGGPTSGAAGPATALAPNRPTAAMVPGVPASGPATEKPEEPPTAAERTIDLAIKKLAELKSVQADLTASVDMLNQQFSIKGRYIKAPNSRVYLKLTIGGLPDSAGTTLQVCDGETLWDYQQVLDAQFYHKLSIKPILERLNSPELDPKHREQAITQMGLAGPQTLLVGLRKAIKFDQKEEGNLDGNKVWVLHGTWKSRQGLAAPNSIPVSPTGVLPPYVPMDASLYLGQENYWPYKLVLVGRKPTVLMDTRRTGPDGRVIGSRTSIDQINPSRIELVYSDVKLNANIRVEEFAFQAPPTATVDDNTEILLKGLDQAIAAQANRKKEEAARKDGAVLDPGLEIPPPPDAPPR